MAYLGLSLQSIVLEPAYTIVSYSLLRVQGRSIRLNDSLDECGS